MIAVPYALVCSLLAGAALLLAFPPYGLWWLAPIGVALLALACLGRRLRAGLGLGLLTGIVFFGPLLAWTNMHVGYTPWILLTLFQASYIALLGAAIAWMTPVLRRWLWSVPLAISTLWVAQEALRDRAPFGGFPWGRLAFSQGDSPALSFAALGGAPLVTFVVALSGGLLVAAAMAMPSRLGGLAALERAARRDGSAPDSELDGDAAKSGGDIAAAADMQGGGGPEGSAAVAIRRAMAWTAAAVAVVAAGLLVPVSLPAGQAVTVAVVQGNVPRLGLEFNEQRKAVLDNHVDATIDLAAAGGGGSGDPAGPGGVAGERLGYRSAAQRRRRCRDRLRGGGHQARRFWWARSCAGRARTSHATPASCGSRG